MAKTFTCNDCGNCFPGGPSTRTCPNCGSSNIKVGGGIVNSLPKWAKPVLIGIAVVIVIILLLKGCSGGSGTAKLVETPSAINVEISKIGSSTLKNLRVQVLCETEIIATLQFNSKTKSAVYEKTRMLAGNCYSFRIITKKGEPAKMNWSTGTQYCMETPPPAPVIAGINCEPNQKTKVYKVTIMIADTSSADQYALNEEWQGSNVFENVKHGEYTVYAKNAAGTTSQELFLKEIKEPLPPPDVKAILNAVSEGRMSASDAQERLAAGHVNLKHKVHTADGGSLSTLWDVLTEASYGTHFKVNDFKIDPQTNKIKSGSLDISVR